MPRWVLQLAIATGFGLVVGCLLDLQPMISCGDGWVDREAGELCDPADPASYEDACAEVGRPMGMGACDPVACTPRVDDMQCGLCGDGIKDVVRDEQCDGDPGDAMCPSGIGQMQCDDKCRLDDSACEQCGDGEPDFGEECDDRATLGGLVTARDCAAGISPSGAQEGIDAPVAKGYAAGQVTRCEDCRWDRGSCNYCGDGQLDLTTPIDFGVPLPQPEVCDGDRFDENRFSELIAGPAASCADEAETTGLSLRPNVACHDNCAELVMPEPGEPLCCLRAGSLCPAEDDPYPCCYVISHPETASERGCATQMTTMGQEQRCRPLSG